MNVLFSNPPWWKKREANNRHTEIGIDWYAGVRAGSRWPHTIPTPSRPDDFIFGSYLPYPFFMGYAASWVERKTGADVVFRDSIALRESYESYYRFLSESSFDYIFVESASSSWDHDQEIVHRIHQLAPRSRLVLVGPITTKGEALLEEVPIVAAIKGEYEKGAQKVIEGATGLLENDLLSLEEMNSAPFPYMDNTLAPRYYDGISRSGGYEPPEFQLWSSRGCPYKCIFCVWPAVMTGNDPDGAGRRSVRHYSADYMEAYIREYVDRFGFKTLYFDDDTFNLGDRHVLGICEVMERIGLPWAAMCRADTIKQDTWVAMKESGCYKVKIGYESGNQWVLDHIVNKRLDLEKARETTDFLSSIGLKVHGTFTYGLPGETSEQMLDTKRFIASLPLDSLQESGTATLEGTPLATLAQQSHLERYDGATSDPSYDWGGDGAEKIRNMGMPDVEAAVHRSVNFGRLAKVDSRLHQAWQRILDSIRERAGRGAPVMIWGLGTDFALMLETFPDLHPLLAEPGVELLDYAWAGREVLGKTVRKPQDILRPGAFVVLTPRNACTRESMWNLARECDVAADGILDCYKRETAAA
ncbi:radical SAM protein [Magnetovirga frankeli]|nr:radical SAM protein [gamma proteobacterium SS-5]